MESERSLSILPTEILSQIFSFLSYRDLASVVLVSRLWNRVGEDPWLWRNFNLKIRNFEAMKIRRFRRVKNVSLIPGLVTTKEDKNSLMKILKAKSLTDLNMNHNNIKSISPKRLAIVLTKMVKVKNLELSNMQALELFTAISHKTQLKELDICSTDFQKIPIDIFTRAIYKLSRLNLKFSILTKQQIEIMFEALSEDKQGKDIDIEGTENMYKMNMSGFAPYVSGFAPYEKRINKLSRIVNKRNYQILKSLRENEKKCLRKLSRAHRSLIEKY